MSIDKYLTTVNKMIESKEYLSAYKVLLERLKHARKHNLKDKIVLLMRYLNGINHLIGVEYNYQPKHSSRKNIENICQFCFEESKEIILGAETSICKSCVELSVTTFNDK